MGPPISSLPVAATASSLVGRTGSGSCELARFVSALGMPTILPYVAEGVLGPVAVAVTGCLAEGLRLVYDKGRRTLVGAAALVSRETVCFT
ncbi:hypothetical protein GCM10023080_064630 [Streptomyces pseudoechinosporeus]